MLAYTSTIKPRGGREKKERVKNGKSRDVRDSERARGRGKEGEKRRQKLRERERRRQRVDRETEGSWLLMTRR